MIINRVFKFDSAHKLSFYEGSCKNLHGHTWKLVVGIEGEIDKKTGMIVDFADIKKIVDEKVIGKLDHTYLNDIIENPTCENILSWIKKELEDSELEGVKKLALFESENCFCEIEI